MSSKIPETQTAVQLVGPDELTLNTQKQVHKPGPHQILCRIEAVGLCFSDLKLLKQFSTHARKSTVVSGICQDVLKEVPSYVPGELATVPGHELVVRVCEIGDQVKDIKLDGRYLVQTDYRWLPTAASNSALGYNFEGGLQEYVLMDQRVITSPDGQSMLIPANDELSASAIALAEPWACVEQSYAVKERTGLKSGGEMLIVADQTFDPQTFSNFLANFGTPAKITSVSDLNGLSGLDIEIAVASDISQLQDAAYDDVIYFGSNPETVEALFVKIATRGMINIVLCGGHLGRDVVTTVGRIHYGNIRITGTAASDPADSMGHIPQSGEIRVGDKINVVGAGGPMGVMHVIRNICQGVEDVSVFAGDLDDKRLAALSKIATGLAEKNNVGFQTYNSTVTTPDIDFDYTAIMAPIPALVANAVKTAPKRGIINIFAGIPAAVTGKIDLDTYIQNQLYFIGTSGSTLDDMRTVLAKVQSRSLDTNLSMAAVCGLNHAVEGIRAVENRLIPGKIVVYPACKDLPLLTLDKLADKLPHVAECLDDGLWNEKAETMLLQTCKDSL